MQYIIEVTNGNAKVLTKGDDGMYRVIAMVTGDDQLPNVRALVELANLQVVGSR